MTAKISDRVLIFFQENPDATISEASEELQLKKTQLYQARYYLKTKGLIEFTFKKKLQKTIQSIEKLLKQVVLLTDQNRDSYMQLRLNATQSIEKLSFFQDCRDDLVRLRALVMINESLQKDLNSFSLRLQQAEKAIQGVL